MVTSWGQVDHLKRNKSRDSRGRHSQDDANKAISQDEISPPTKCQATQRTHLCILVSISYGDGCLRSLYILQSHYSSSTYIPARVAFQLYGFNLLQGIALKLEFLRSDLSVLLVRNWINNVHKVMDTAQLKWLIFSRIAPKRTFKNISQTWQ